VAVRLDDAKSFCHAHGLPYVRLITREVEAIGSCAATGALDMYDDWMLDASIETGGTINECSDDDVRTRPDLAPPNKNNKISEVQMSQGFGHRLFRLLVVTKTGASHEKTLSVSLYGIQSRETYIGGG
jgi:hypothetical protein